MLFDAVGLYEKPDWDTRLFTPTTPAELDQLDALLMPHPPQVPGFVARDILRVSNKNAWVIHRAVDSMLTGQDATDNLLPQLKMPVLIVWGAEDRIVPLSQGETHAPPCAAIGAGWSSRLRPPGPDQCTAQVGPKVVEFLKR